MPKVEVNCEQCGEKFLIWPYRLLQHRVFCSRRCNALAKRGTRPSNRASLIGQKFGKLTVIDEAGCNKGHALWRCRCDCGTSTVASTGSLRYGTVRSCGCLTRRRGSDHPNWKQGFHITQEGHRETPVLGSTARHRYRAEHRVVAERLIGRCLHPWEVVHHKNRDRQDNRPDNLMVMTRRSHAALHAREERACLS